MTRAFSGRPLSEITLDALVGGALTLDDVRVHPDTLRGQARIALDGGNPQLAANLRRAAELTALPESRVLDIYEALRPHRSSRAELEAIAGRLESEQAPLCAALVREALAAYAARDLLR